MYAFNIGRCAVPAASNNPAVTRTIRIAQRIKMGKRLLLLILFSYCSAEDLSMKYRSNIALALSGYRAAGRSRSERDVMTAPFGRSCYLSLELAAEFPQSDNATVLKIGRSCDLVYGTGDRYERCSACRRNRESS